MRDLFDVALNLVGGLGVGTLLGLDQANDLHVKGVFIQGLHKLMDKSGLPQNRTLRLVRLLGEAVQTVLEEGK